MAFGGEARRRIRNAVLSVEFVGKQAARVRASKAANVLCQAAVDSRNGRKPFDHRRQICSASCDAVADHAKRFR